MLERIPVADPIRIRIIRIVKAAKTIRIVRLAITKIIRAPVISKGDVSIAMEAVTTNVSAVSC